MTTPTARKGLEEIRDEVARLHGWTQEGPPQWRSVIWKPPGWPDCKQSACYHPFPATLNGAASAMPEGWSWARWADGCWIAAKTGETVLGRPGMVEVIIDTGDEVYDRYALALAALEAGVSK